MQRQLSPVFLHARDALEEVLSSAGFKLERETLDYAAFGSGTIEWRHRAHWLCLTYDGKDGHLSLSGAIASNQHAFPAPGSWEPLSGTAGNPGLAIRGVGPLFQSQVAELVAQVTDFIRTPSAG